MLPDFVAYKNVFSVAIPQCYSHVTLKKKSKMLLRKMVTVTVRVNEALTSIYIIAGSLESAN